MHDDQYDDKDTADRRRRGWTLWREIYGTVLGTLPFVVMISIWASTVQQRLGLVELEITHAKQLREADREAAREAGQNIDRKLDRIALQIENLQQGLARSSASLNGR